MNQTRLLSIFKKYIDHFELLTNHENDETYKWEIAQEFQNFDVDSDNFAEMLAYLWKKSDNLIDNAKQLPFYALTYYAKIEPETVREMFRKLYAQEHVNYKQKQALIDDFIASSEKLREKYYPDGRIYANDQRSVMMYLFLRYPNSNYGYKAKQAKSFADCIEYYENWGPMHSFDLEKFAKMCEQLISEIKKNDALMATHMSRFENTQRNLFPDQNLHILALDIIYSSQAYDFYGDMTFNPITSEARKLYFERVAKAKELEAALINATHNYELSNQVKNLIKETFKENSIISHKTFGIVTLESFYSDTGICVKNNSGEIKKIDLAISIKNNLIGLPLEVQDKFRQYISILGRQHEIESTFKRANENIKPYLEYLD